MRHIRLHLIGLFTLFFILHNLGALIDDGDPRGFLMLVAIVAAIALFVWLYRSQPPTVALPPRPQPTRRSRRKTPARQVAPPPRITTMTIDATLDALPHALLARSGSLFYTGPAAFTGTPALYILGLNPGGSPSAQAEETIARDLAEWRALGAPWSAYLDESWQGRPPGTHGMQPRMRHMFDQLGLDLRLTPASNVVFPRSTTEAALAAEKAPLLAQCWPVHQAVIKQLGIRTILCLGGTAGRWTRERIGATRLLDSFAEANARGWRSEAHGAPDGRAVITVTHPGRADWRNPAADPTPLVSAVLARQGARP